MNRQLGSPAYPAPEQELRDSADRRADLGRVRIPALVIHGAEDPLIPCAAGEDLADAIPRSLFLKIRGMGHDIPAELFGVFVAAISANAARDGGPAA